jgi:YVTN family beta-propeller protein
VSSFRGALRNTAIDHRRRRPWTGSSPRARLRRPFRSASRSFPCAGAGAAPFAYVTNTFSDNVSVVDTATRAVVATIPVGNGPQGVAVNAAGTRVYVANGDSPYGVSVIDTATNSVIDTFPVIDNPGAIVVRPDGKRLYVGLNFSGKVSVFNTEGDADTFVTNVTVASPSGMAAHPDGTRIYIANDVFPDATLSVLDTATNTLGTPIPLQAKFLRGVAINNAGTRVYVPASSSSRG